jgi:plastocyanin
MRTRDMLVKLPVLGMLAFAAACGGGDQAAEQTAAPATDAPAATAEAPAAPAADASAPAAQGQVHEVKMVTTQGGASGVFEPAELTVKKGDIVRFVTDGAAPHNASFPAAENPSGAALPAATPYLAAAGQTADIQITMDAGSYTYQCDPHAAMGMKGKITVQ